MNFGDFINKAWRDHASDALAVSESIVPNYVLIETNEQIPQMVQLLVHVCGEHLGKWNAAIEALELLKTHKAYQAATESESTILRSVAAMQICAGLNQELHAFNSSDQVRIWAVAASALSEQNQTENAIKYFQQALEVSSKITSKDDPANKSLAITGNNLACALEEKQNRSQQQTELMLLSAAVARKFWELAGTWLHVERAEYRLAQSNLKASLKAEALKHAHLCIEICEANKAEALEFFYGYEVLALCQKAEGNQAGYLTAVNKMKEYFNQLSDDHKKWCESTLAKI